MPPSEHILIVDDDDRLRNRLAAYLRGEGFRVETARDGDELRRMLAEEAPDLIILDLVMPGEDGLSLTRHIRANYGSGIVILTGKGESVDRIVGLEMGADDYIAKPFELRELLARLRSVLRRLGPPRNPGAVSDSAAESNTTVRRFSGWELDLGARRLTSPQEVDVPLTTAEFNILAAFVDNPNLVLDRDRLLDVAGGREWQPFDRSVDLHISHLRRKIEANPKRPEIIQTMRGAGYIFTATVERG